MRRRSISAAVVVAAVILGGCSASSSGGSHTVPPLGIRGTELPAFGCHAQPDGKAVRVVPAAVIELRLCPIVAPSPFNQPPKAISLTANSPGFVNLLRALSLPDASATPGQMCPEYAELLAPVIARTRSASLLVHLPVDGCMHTLPAVRAALNAVINGAGASPSAAAG